MSPEGFLHCGFCGSSFAAATAERRKLATLLFCDMTGSTAMGERVDPEAVRELMLSYFHEVRGALERHGGTVEKFIGDAVMAVFGVPVAHEDDALRACRAASEMQARLASLNESFEQRFGTRIALRIGLNTGEIVAGDASSRETFVTGDAVNVAARLEQAAGPGEVLLGEPTYRLVRDVVNVKAVEPLALKGKSASMPAYRLLGISGLRSLPRRIGTPLVGRDEELALLEHEFDESAAVRRCRLVTVVGDPGVGKSRLAAELIGRLGARAHVLRGRCLSYGDGITYWALGEIVRQAAGIHDEHSGREAVTRIDALLDEVQDGRTVATLIAQLLGLIGGVATSPETAWAIRRFLTAQARERPLLLVVDDIHWAEAALLELLDGLPAAIEDSPMLVLCLARPELLEIRPDWRPTIPLEPLPAADVDALIENLFAGAPAPIRARLATASAGNPLFAEELVGMLVDERAVSGAGSPSTLAPELDAIALPASLNALLSARLDRLDPAARDALERGAIEGEIFHRGAVVELSDATARHAVPDQLELLAGKGFLLPAPASFVGEAAFRFKHILLRDAAYQGTAKKLRALLHEQFAGWLELFAGERVNEYEEILGYHLEQSCRYRVELAPPDEEAHALATRAASRLASAGRRAWNRGDAGTASDLLARGFALLPANSREQIELVPALVESLAEGARVNEAEQLVEAGLAAGAALGDERLSALVEVQRIWLEFRVDPRGSSARALVEAERAIRVFERHGDDVSLARAWEVVTEVHAMHGHLAAARAASERRFFHAERSGDERQQRWHRVVLASTARYGFVPLGEVQQMMEDDLAWARQAGSLWLEAMVLHGLGLVHSVRGDPAGGKALLEHGRSIISELGMRLISLGYLASWIWWLTEDPIVAEIQLRESDEALDAAGEKGTRSTIVANLAEALYRQGRYDEAEEIAIASAELGADDDVSTQALVWAVRAKILARRDLAEEAEAMAREAVALAGDTEFVDLRAETLLALGEVLQLADRRDDAVAAIRGALDLWQTKGNVVFAGRARRLLSEASVSVD
jgi:class 3 adenylate cyclase/tetratricopeptide (TPR) repeat protein